MLGHLDAAQPRRAHDERADRFRTVVAPIGDRDVGAHREQQLEQPRARRVETDVLDRQLARTGDAARDHEERCRGEIAGHGDACAGQRLAAAQDGGRALAPDVDAEAAQHALGMVAGDGRFGDPGLAVGVQPGEQHGGLHLRARHRHGEVDALQTLAAADVHRRTALAGLDVRAHQPQRRGGALHRTAHERRVADERRVEGLTGEQPHEEPHRRAGVAHVERLRAALETVGSHTLHLDHTRCRTRDRHPERAQRTERREAVLALEEALDVGGPAGDAAQHQGAVRHRLVTRDAQPTARSGSRRDAPGSSRRGGAQTTALKGRRADRTRARGTARRGP